MLDENARWQEPAGPRFIRYPFYSQIISLEVADRIFEALLRCGGNLVIPASFVDVMSPPEAALVRRALKQPGDPDERLDEAGRALEAFLAVRKRAARGRWQHWYRGDRKVNVPALLQRLRRE